MTDITTTAPVPSYTATFLVEGMTCSHCVGSVTEELTDGVPGVQNVQIDLASGEVIVVSDLPIAQAAATAAVQEAGYQLTPGSWR
jgi:copper chaperone